MVDFAGQFERARFVRERVVKETVVISEDFKQQEEVGYTQERRSFIVLSVK